MSLVRRFRQLINKQADESVAKGNHAFRLLKVGEVSLVTDPAILTEEEVEDGAGVVVLKMMTDDEPAAEVVPDEVPEELEAVEPVADVETETPSICKAFLAAAKKRAKQVTTKVFPTKDNEDIYEAIGKLLDGALAKLSNELNDQDVWWTMYPMRITDKSVILVDGWDYFEHPTDATYYKMDFTRGEDGFEFGDVQAMRLEFQDAEDTVTKILRPMEKAMKTFKGFRIGDHTITVKATPGNEYKLGDTITVKVDSEGDVSVDCVGHVFEEGQSLDFDEDGYLTFKTADAEMADEPVAPEAKAATEVELDEDGKPVEKSFEGLATTLPQMLAMMADSGKPFTLEMGTDGTATAKFTPVDAEMDLGLGEAPTEDAVEDEEVPEVDPAAASELEEARKAAENAEAALTEAKKVFAAKQEVVHKAAQAKAGGGTDVEAAVDAAIAEERRDVKKIKNGEDPPAPKGRKQVFKAFDWMGILPGDGESPTTN